MIQCIVTFDIYNFSIICLYVFADVDASDVEKLKIIVQDLLKPAGSSDMKDGKSLNTQHSDSKHDKQGLDDCVQIRQVTEDGKKFFQCSLCQKTFTQKCGAQSHLRTHTGDKPFKCCMCENKFSFRVQLKRHEAGTHMKEKPYKCRKCPKQFALSHALKQHAVTHRNMPRQHQKDGVPGNINDDEPESTKKDSVLDPEIWPPDSEICGDDEDCLTVPIMVKKIKQDGEIKYQCNICKKMFGSKSDAVAHGRIHTGEKPFQCESCDATFTFRVQLRRHEVIHTGILPFKCNFCPKSFALKHARKQHETRHVKKAKRRFSVDGQLAQPTQVKQLEQQGKVVFQCGYCQRIFNSKTNARAHERIHTGEKPYKCDECGLRFTNHGSLKYHQHDHDAGDSKFFMCHLCGKGLKTPSALKSHVQTHTREWMNTKSNACPHCGKLFKTEQGLSMHIKGHLGEKPFQCTHCGERFVHKSSLRVHERIHTGEKPFKCQYCAKGFTQVSALVVHERIHTGEKPFKCQYCEKAFPHRGDVKGHERTHTGEKPYKCRYCDSRFSRSSGRAKHEKIHLKKIDESFPMASHAFS